MRQVCLAVVMLAVATGSLSSAAKPTTYAVIPLTVTVHAHTFDGLPCGICGDKVDTLLGEPVDTVYTDGEDGVEAKADEFGSLIIDFQKNMTTQIRGLRYKYPASFGVLPATGTNQYLATNGAAKALQLMGLLEWQTVRTCPTYDDQASQRRYVHTFNRDCYVSDSGSTTLPLKVTRTISATPQWTVESQAPHTSRVFHVAMKGRLQPQIVGDGSLPFSMTLTAKP